MLPLSRFAVVSSAIRALCAARVARKGTFVNVVITALTEASVKHREPEVPGGDCLCAALQQHRLDMADGARRVQSFRTDAHTVHDAMTAEYAESIIQIVETRIRFGVAAVNQETVCRQQASRPDELLRVPPE